MATIKKIEVGGTNYDIEDEVARNTASSADSTATQAASAIGDLDDLETTIKTDVVSAINEVNEEVSNKDNEFFFNVFIPEDDTYLFLNSVLSEKLGVDFPNLPNGTVLLVRYYNNTTYAPGTAFNMGNSFIKTNGTWQEIEGENSDCYMLSSGLCLENPSSSNSCTCIGYVKLLHSYVES